MSPTINIGSAAEFNKLLSSSAVVVSDFYADWCGPCKAVAPTYESLSTKYSKPGRIIFTKINVDHQQQIAQQHGVRAMPTFIVFKSGRAIENIQGADVRRLTNAIEAAVKLVGEAAPGFASAGRTLGGTTPPGRSLQKPYNFQSLLDTMIAFVGLYLYSLFSLDPYAAAEKSPFNIHKANGKQGTKSTGVRPGGGKGAGKRVGTLSDLTSGD